MHLLFPRLLLASVLCLAATLCATPAALGETLQGGETSLTFEATILSSLGIGVQATGNTAPPTRPGGLGFAISATQSQLSFAAPGGDFERFAQASIQHSGGFTLILPGGDVVLDGVRLEADSEGPFLRIVDAQGQAWLDALRPHAQLSADGSVLVIQNADLLATPALAAELGQPGLTGSYLGVLDATLRFAPAPPGPLLLGPGDCIPDIGDPVDVELTVLGSTTQAAREIGGRVALAPAAELINNGPGDVAWNRAIKPDTPLGPHPYLALNMYRLVGDVLEQIGRADLKHAFFATNTGCACPGGHVLFDGCEDQYGVNTNLNQTYLAPRDELDVLDRSWISLASHFDGVPDDDDTRDHFGASDHDSFEHRLTVQDTDLQTPGARYFVEAWYLAPHDTNLLNSLGHRELSPSLFGSTWLFTNAAPMELGSILDVWVDPLGPDPGEQSSFVDTGEGRLQLAAVTTDLGGGTHHYEWALQNFDFESQLRSFSVPVLPGMNITNTGFGDGDEDAGNQWSVDVSAHRVTWTAPAGNELDWGRLYNFRLDADAAPLSSLGRMQPLDTPATISVATLAPAAITSIPALPWPLLAPALAAAGALALRRNRA